jgi:hypothetical protein
MNLDDIISLADAAQDLGIDPSGLRAQAAAGRLQARLVGKTWITTRQEVERYRRDRLGRVGRPPGVIPPGATATVVVPKRPTATVVVPKRPTATVVVPKRPTATVKVPGRDR